VKRVFSKYTIYGIYGNSNFSEGVIEQRIFSAYHAGRVVVDSLLIFLFWINGLVVVEDWISGEV